MGARILTLQRQARELGRLRTGYTDGKRPMRSRTWVISSHAEHYVEAAAKAWGGTVESWTPLNSKIPQFRVITEAESIDALLPPGDPLSQYNEMWSGGGCQRRCNGETEQISRQACLCLAQFGEDWHQQPKGRVCSATSRINVMLPDMPDLGVWRAETHSFYAANEWGGTVDMVLSGTGGQGLVPVSLRIEPRQRVAGGQTKKFPVVVVEVRGITPRQALTGPLPTALALDPAGAEQPLALEAGRPDYIAEAEGALTSDDVRDVWRKAAKNGDVDPKGTDPLSKKLMALAALKDEEDKGPDEDGAYEAEVIEEAS
ncbi:hypothetical protein [Streptomyces yunnanensis]|uniref:Uncharacterized protein n=1 Tax=Streptomyces yunnanensis TaxID=156453 RepID=A0A9X8MT44_9ACTN|nr:hypothetical protein [Streptomyces yunnanensis]SHL73487.1 hypothetical protein SAMN05216268_10616 [Streptomyces yunnanensis]